MDVYREQFLAEEQQCQGRSSLRHSCFPDSDVLRRCASSERTNIGEKDFYSVCSLVGFYSLLYFAF